MELIEVDHVKPDDRGQRQLPQLIRVVRVVAQGRRPAGDVDRVDVGAAVKVGGLEEEERVPDHHPFARAQAWLRNAQASWNSAFACAP